MKLPRDGFFRNVPLTVGKSDFESIGLARLEELSNSRWATDVRKLDIWFNSPFIAGMDRHSVEFRDFFERLRSLFMKFPNLEAFNLYPNVYDRRYEAFINIAVNTIRSSSLERLTELELSHDYSEYRGFEEFIPMETDSETPRGGLENLRHLGLKGHFTWEKGIEFELLQRIQISQTSVLLHRNIAKYTPIHQSASTAIPATGEWRHYCR